MAIKLTAKANTDPVVPGVWPYGKVRDEVGLVPGTNYDENTIGDHFQFFENLMAVSGLVHNGQLDNEANGFQLYQALKILFPLRSSIVPIGVWDMNANPSVLVNVPGIDFTKIREMSAIILDDFGTGRTMLLGDGQVAAQDGTNDVGLTRNAGSIYTGIGYSGVANRGYIVLSYLD